MGMTAVRRGMTEPSEDRAGLLESLRRAIARGESRAPESPVKLGGGIDGALPGGGLARSAIHEILVSESEISTIFCGYILGRAGGTVAWIGPPAAGSLPWPPGLAALGLDPAALILLEAGGDDALWAAEEALRCPALAAVAAYLPRLDLAAARRLQLAAESGGTLGLLLRPERGRPAPTAARTRWRATSLPGRGGAAHRLGAPRWRLALLLARGAVPRSWDVTFDSHDKTLIQNDHEQRAEAHG